MLNDNANPLVTVIVITYNSAAYVLETLESAKQQSYKHIELIISDDKSTDETVAICQNWISENKLAFKNTKIITTEINTGIPANCNRALKAAKGEWIKIIAGDDALYPETIEKYINFVTEQNDSEIKIIQSNIDVFTNDFNEKNYLRTDDLSELYQTKKQATASEQFEIMIRDPHLNTPSLLIKNELFDSIGLYDERYRLMEDFPWLLKALKSGIKIYFLNFSSVKYRKTTHSIQIAKTNDVYISNFIIQRDLFVFQNVLKDYTIIEKLFFLWKFKASNFVFYNGINNKKILNKILINLILGVPIFFCKRIISFMLCQKLKSFNRINY